MTPTLQEDVQSWRVDRDETAARRLIDALYPQVIRIVRNHLPFRTDEEDLAQEIFAHFFRTLDRYDPARPLENWLSRLALRVCLNALRARKRRPELRWSDLSEEEARAAEALQDAGAEESIPGTDARALLVKMLDALSPGDRLVITLLHLEEKSLRDIQALTGWSSVIIRMRAYRARRKLRKLLDRLV